MLDPAGGPSCWTLSGDLCKNRLPARIRGWAGTATGGQIHVVHISHTHPPKELIQALRKYLLGKTYKPTPPARESEKNIQSNPPGPKIRKKTYDLTGFACQESFQFSPKVFDLYCTALHCIALYCTVLYCTALHCTVLHCTALHCTELHCTALHCNAM